MLENRPSESTPSENSPPGNSPLSNSPPGNHCPFSDIFQWRYQVVASDIDAMNHVNNLEYLRWTLKAAHAHSQSVGWSSTRFRVHGAGFIVRSHRIKYRLPALIDDHVTIKTWIHELTKVSSIRKYHIIRTHDDKRLADVETNWVFVDFDTMRPTPIPAAIGDAFATAIQSDPTNRTNRTNRAN